MPCILFNNEFFPHYYTIFLNNFFTAGSIIYGHVFPLPGEELCLTIIPYC